MHNSYLQNVYISLLIKRFELLNIRKRTFGERKSILEQSEKLQNMTVDKKKQRFTDKFCEDFHYHNNPLYRHKSQDIPDVSRLNKQIEDLKKKKQKITEKKKFLNENNRRCLDACTLLKLAIISTSDEDDVKNLNLESQFSIYIFFII